MSPLSSPTSYSKILKHLENFILSKIKKKKTVILAFEEKLRVKRQIKYPQFYYVVTNTYIYHCLDYSHSTRFTYIVESKL